jgi:hypothetical protein
MNSGFQGCRKQHGHHMTFAIDPLGCRIALLDNTRLPKWLVTICACACLLLPGSLHATEHKGVLILHSVGREFRPWNEYAKQIRAELDRQSPWPLDVREHSLESARSGDTNPELPFVQYLRALYAERVPDLIVAVGAPAAAFVRRHRQRSSFQRRQPCLRQSTSAGSSIRTLRGTMPWSPLDTTSAFSSRAFCGYRQIQGS